MIGTWYAILTFMLLMFLVLEGFDIGAGMLQHFAGKTPPERRLVIAAIGPLWSWHEVWLVGFGGTLLLAFPPILAASFAGFYLAFMLLLWGLILRGISLEVSGHVPDPLWRTGWHVCFAAANVLLAVLIGAALGNILRGVPVAANGKFALAFFTNFQPSGEVGILDWYTLSTALFIVVTFAAHGANGVAHRTEGPVHDRSRRIAGILWKWVVVLLALITLETWRVNPDLYPRMFHQPFGWLGMIGVAGGLLAVARSLRKGNDRLALAGSSVFIAGLVIAGAAGVFPFMLRSTLDPRYSVSVYNGAAAGRGLEIAMVWWPLALVLAGVYFFFIYRFYDSKVTAAKDVQNPY